MHTVWPIGSNQVLLLWAKVDLGVMAMKGYFALFRDPELEPHHLMQSNVITRLSLHRGYNQNILSPANKMWKSQVSKGDGGVFRHPNYFILSRCIFCYIRSTSGISLIKLQKPAHIHTHTHTQCSLSDFKWKSAYFLPSLWFKVKGFRFIPDTQPSYEGEVSQFE